MRFKYKFSLDKRRKLQSGKYPIKINVHSYADNSNRYVSIPTAFTSEGRLEFSCKNSDEFDSIWTNRHKKDSFGNVKGETTVYGEKLQLRDALKKWNDRLNAFIEDEDTRTFSDIREAVKHWDEALFKVNMDLMNVWNAFDDYANKQEEEKSYKYAESIRSSKKSFKKFVSLESIQKKLRLPESYKRLLLTHIDIDFLNTYEKWIYKNGLSKSTVGVYTRSLRAVWNDVLGEKHPDYPFGKGGYTIPEGVRKNQGLSKADVKKIVDFSSDNERLQKARDYFLFCFYNGGANIKDVLHLKKGQKHFKRLKSIRTAKKEVLIPVIYNDITNDIIKRHTGKGDYMFDVIKEKDSAKTRQDKVDALNRFLRDELHKLSDLLELEHKITANWSRHTHTTILYKEGINLKAISEGLGHTNLKTTEGYINTMIDEERPKIDKALSFDDDDDSEK